MWFLACHSDYNTVCNLLSQDGEWFTGHPNLTMHVARIGRIHVPLERIDSQANECSAVFLETSHQTPQCFHQVVNTGLL